MLANKLFAELLGTFVFISVIFRYAAKEWGAFAIGAALAVVVLFGGAISGGHFNPAVSLAMFVGNKITAAELGGYVAMQLIGGYAAWAYFAGALAPGGGGR
jgi:aquaporin Z